MFDIVSGKLPVDVKPSPVSASSLLIQNFEMDIRNYIDWRNRDVSSVPVDHWMVSLIFTLGQKLGYDLNRSVEDIYRRVDFLSNEIAMTFGFTTMANPGRLHIGDSGNTTIYLIGKSPLRKGVSRTTPYADMVPIRYLSHDSTNVSMGSPAEKEELIGLGMDAIEIDLGLLMLQFTLWTKEQVESGETDLRNPQMFVGMHVLPKLKFSQYAIAFMNRIAATAEGLPTNDTFYRLSKGFADRTRDCQNIISQLAEVYLKRDVTFEYLLGSLPVPMMGTLGVAGTIPEYIPTRQITWALVLSRYNLVRYLFALGRVDPVRAKRYPVNDIRRVINRLINDGGLRQTLGISQRKDIEAKLDDLITRSFPV